MSTTLPHRVAVLTGIQPDAPFPIRIATSFLKAGFTRLALLGPSEPYLGEIKATLLHDHPQVTILTQKIDLTSPESIGLASHTIRSELGAWDVLIHSATPVTFSTSTSPQTTIRGADSDLWWSPFELNVRSLPHIARHFFPKTTAKPKFINVLSIDPSAASVSNNRNSAENASQLAAARVVEYLGMENEGSGMRVVNFVVTEEDLKLDEERMKKVDDLLVWCASEEAGSVSGRTVLARNGREGLQ